MNLLYEEDGEYKAGTALSQAPASFQVETAHGRRAKVKSSHVVLQYERPAAAEMLPRAQEFAATLETEFLWQCCGKAEFGFQDLAREYVGREATPVEAAGVLLKLQSAPMYFYRRGRGRFQAAPEETLKLALAGAEKKRLQQERIAAWAECLARFEIPEEIARLREELLYAPDRARPETKALEQACAQTGLSAAKLFERGGLLKDSHAYHLGRFLHEFPPGGATTSEDGLSGDERAAARDLPLAACAAFSLDDIGTSEIDDAFSVTRVSDDELRIGIHIAAPGLVFAPGSTLDAIARGRLSTAYFPGCKFTMLPEAAIAELSLDEGCERPSLSLYLNVGATDFALRGRHTKLERVRMAANLRHAGHDALNAAFEKGAQAGLPYEEELRTLWQFALARESSRGKPSVSAAQPDYVFRVEGERVSIETRKRGAPLDKLVAELMILANTAWGELLAERDIAAIYRVQASGKVRMSVHPEMHEGLGVSTYAWFTSPLRRYVDLVNQWQLVSAVRGQRAPLARNSEALLAALRAFEVTSARYDEHQRALEHYWCLRWLGQEGIAETGATVLRENLVRLDSLPLVLRVPSLPELEPGARVRLAVGEADLIERVLTCTWRATLGQETA